MSLFNRITEAENSIKNRKVPVAMPMPTGEIDTEAVMALIQKLRSDVDKAEENNFDNFKRNNADIM